MIQLLISDLQSIAYITNSSCKNSSCTFTLNYGNSNLQFDFPLRSQIFTPTYNNIILGNLPLQFSYNPIINLSLSTAKPALTNFSVTPTSKTFQFSKNQTCVSHFAGWCQVRVSDGLNFYKFQDHFQATCQGCKVVNYEIQEEIIAESVDFNLQMFLFVFLFNFACFGWYLGLRKRK